MAGDAGIRDGEVSRSLASICSTGRLKTTSIVVGPKGVAVSHTRGNGTALYWLACQLDREGIVAKRANSRHEGRGGTCLSERGRCTYHTDLRRDKVKRTSPVFEVTMMNWAKKIVDELHGAGASPEHLSTAVIAICMGLLFVVLVISAVALFL